MNKLNKTVMLEKDRVEALETAIEKIGSRSSSWIWILFGLSSISGTFNAMHIMSYVFLLDIPQHWCEISILTEAGWTRDEIKAVSAPNSESSCSYYNWDYEYFKSIGYKDAINYVNSTAEKPNLIECENFQYNEKYPKSTVVSEWDLVCQKATLRSLSQAVFASGKFLGGILFGVVSDKYGRKWSFMLASILYMVSGPLGAFAPSFMMFNIARCAVGIAGSGVYETSYTIMTEIASNKFRTMFACLFNISYPLGYIVIPVLALLSHDWRQLQKLISIPLLILCIHFWFLPESPRWLMSKSKYDEAWEIVEWFGYKQPIGTISSQITRTDDQENPGTSDDKDKDTSLPNQARVEKTLIRRLKHLLKRVFSLFSTREIRRRTFICYFAWFSVSLCYYIIAFNADNFTTDKYVYCALNGIVEAPGYILSFICLASFGRKPVCCLLFLLSGISLLTILIIPQEFHLFVIVMALSGRFCVSAVFAVIILQTSELFPTVNRNSAIGTSLTVCQLGAIAAPYIVDSLGGKHYWYLPSTLCGILSLFTAMLVSMLPETKNKPLRNTIEEVEKLDDEDRVSIKLCCKFS